MIYLALSKQRWDLSTWSWKNMRNQCELLLHWAGPWLKTQSQSWIAGLEQSSGYDQDRWYSTFSSAIKSLRRLQARGYSFPHRALLVTTIFEFAGISTVIFLTNSAQRAPGCCSHYQEWRYIKRISWYIGLLIDQNASMAIFVRQMRLCNAYSLSSVLLSFFFLRESI